MNVGSLFSGIGGLDHGLASAGHKHVFFCEADAYRRDVLRARWPGVPVYEDVHALPDAHAGCSGGGVVRGEGADGRVAGTVGQQDATPHHRDAELPHERKRQSNSRDEHVDLLCGGFPCQDLSVAGRRKGLAGERSGLFFEFARIIDAVRPGWVLVENVPGLLSSQGGRDFGVVLGTLADLGYGVAWRVLDSRFFGVPQRRRRVFIVGALIVGDPRAAAERAGEVLAVGSGCPRHVAARGEAREEVAGTLGGGAGERGWSQDVERMTFLPVANTMKSQRGRNGGGIGPEETLVAATSIAETVRSHPRPGSNSNGNLVSFDAGFSNQGAPDDKAILTRKLRRAISSPATGVRRLTPTECERLQGLPGGWTQLGDTPDSRRYSALGDAVTATVAEWIGHRLEEVAGDACS